LSCDRCQYVRSVVTAQRAILEVFFFSTWVLLGFVISPAGKFVALCVLSSLSLFRSIVRVNSQNDIRKHIDQRTRETEKERAARKQAREAIKILQGEM
jgi:hypothetical protein